MVKSIPHITVIGAGNVGAAAAQQVLAQQLGRVTLLDVAAGVAKGKALDLNQSAPILGYMHPVVGTSDYAQSAGSDVIIITAGAARKPGMSRDDLIKTNHAIVRSVVEQAIPHSPEAVLIIVTNPLDVMTYTALRVSRWPRERVIGMAGILDTARYRWFLSQALGISPQVISAMVLGGHGDQMVPCVPFTRAAGMPIAELLPAEKLQAIIERTRQGGGEIVQLLGSGSAYYAPAAAAVRMAAAILRDENALLPCAALCQGEFGLEDVVVGVPMVLGRGGMKRIVEISLSDEERQGLRHSAELVRAMCRVVDSM
jgi:malate dehydrogenase